MCKPLRSTLFPYTTLFRSLGDGSRTVLRVANRAHRHHVVLEQLEQDAELEPGREVAEDRSGDGPGHDRARDHHLRHAHEIEPDERAPHEQEGLQLQRHANSWSGTGRAVGTSWAVTSTPCAASSLSLAASASLRYT